MLLLKIVKVIKFLFHLNGNRLAALQSRRYPLKQCVWRKQNVLNITPVSIQRIDYNSDFGDVKGYVLDNITTAIMGSDLLGKRSS